MTAAVLRDSCDMRVEDKYSFRYSVLGIFLHSYIYIAHTPISCTHFIALYVLHMCFAPSRKLLSFSTKSETKAVRSILSRFLERGLYFAQIHEPLRSREKNHHIATPFNFSTVFDGVLEGIPKRSTKSRGISSIRYMLAKRVRQAIRHLDMAGAFKKFCGPGK